MVEREFRKSSYSNTQSACVAASVGAAETLVRDTKAPEAGTLRFSRSAWLTAVARVDERR